MRIMIAGTGSGSGKTTVACALLAAIKRQGKQVVSFKCGPDYIDTTFHRKATEVDSINLDSYLMGEAGVLESLSFHSKGCEIAVVEGVMGLYDGIGKGSENSSNDLSLLTNTPVVLVVDTKGKGLSICAEIQGFLDFERNNIVSVILNRTKKAIYPFYKEMIETRTGIKILGFLPDLPEATFESRHLGLVTADGISDAQNKIARLGDAATESIDFDALYGVAAEAGPIDSSRNTPSIRKPTSHACRIYVAYDEAFCFYYPDNHRILEDCGAELKFLSPLRSPEVPNDADGLLVWGGYPELHAARLAGNESFKRSVRNLHARGMPIYAECGGFMYMQERLTDREGNEHPMLGIVEGTVSMTTRLRKFGYVELTARKDNMLCNKGEKIKAHSFHYSQSSHEGDAFTATRAGKVETYPCITATETLFTGYPHLHFTGNGRFAANFVNACMKYRESK